MLEATKQTLCQPAGCRKDRRYTGNGGILRNPQLALNHDKSLLRLMLVRSARCCAGSLIRLSGSAWVGIQDYKRTSVPGTESPLATYSLLQLCLNAVRIQSRFGV